MTRRQQIIHLYKSGVKRADICRQLSVDPSTVSRVLRQEGEPALRDASYLHRFDRSRAIELHRAGCNDAEIGRQLGVSRGAVREWRKCLRLPVNRWSGFDYRAVEVLSHLKTGKSYSEIGQLMGITRGTVAGIVHRHCRAD